MPSFISFHCSFIYHLKVVYKSICILDIRTLETHLDVIKQKHTEARDPIVAQMRKLADSFQTSAESMKAQVTASIQSQVQSEMQNSFLRYVKCYEFAITILTSGKEENWVLKVD